MTLELTINSVSGTITAVVASVDCANAKTRRAEVSSRKILQDCFINFNLSARKAEQPGTFYIRLDYELHITGDRND